MSCPPAKSCSRDRRRSCCAARISSGRTWAGEEAAMTAGAGATVRTVLDTGGGRPDGAGGPLLADLAEQWAEITGDRQFRVLFAPGQGCAAATQFVGEIPPGRAPFHSHTYDEVVLVLAGEGVLHVGDEDRPL